jgi:hypothetical protein
VGSRHNEGIVLADLGDPAGTRTHHERALAITEATLGPDHPNAALIRRDLDSVVQAGGK